MTLCKLLEIKLSLVNAEDHAGVMLAERMWDRAGQPATRRELIDLLERFIVECGKNGPSYAPIFLRRKREMQRGAWAPRETRQEDPAVNVAADRCPECKGRGYLAAADGKHGSLCKPCLGRGVKQNSPLTGR
jgi:hypothetical protein